MSFVCRQLDLMSIFYGSFTLKGEQGKVKLKAVIARGEKKRDRAAHNLILQRERVRGGDKEREMALKLRHLQVIQLH